MEIFFSSIVRLTSLGFYFFNECGNFFTNTSGKLNVIVPIPVKDTIKVNDLLGAERIFKSFMGILLTVSKEHLQIK